MAKGQTAMRILIWLVAIALILMFIVSITTEPKEVVLPPGFKKTPITGIASTLLQTIGVPDQWLFIPAIIYLFLVPFIGITVIVYGFLSEMHIFSSQNINIILAIVIAFATLPFGVFTKFVTFLFALLGAYSTGAFAFLFIFGVIWVIGNRMNMWGFTRRTESKVLGEEASYDQLEQWLRHVHEQNQHSVNIQIGQTLKQIERALTDADNAMRTQSPEAALRILRNQMRKTTDTLRRHGGIIPPLPPRR